MKRAYLVGETWRQERITAGSAEEAAREWSRRGLRGAPILVRVVVETTGEELEVRLTA